MTLAESLFSNLNVNIKFCQNILHSKDWTERKTKTDYTLWHVHHGNLWLEMNGMTIPVVSNDVVLFFPGDTYRAYTDENGCSFIVTFFTLETGNHLNLLENTDFAGVYHGKEISRLTASFQQDFFAHFHNFVQPTLPQYASFITFLSGLISEHKPAAAFHKNNFPTKKMPLHEILDFMNEHYLESLSMTLLADKMNVSEKFFIQYFHKQVGTSPKQYLIDKRMRHSLSLLADSGNKLSDIALILGYADSYTFSKAFKKYYGEAPSIFRSHLQ